MKNILILLLTIILSTSLFSQNAQVSCDTIILKNNRNLLVRIDSISSDRVYYKKCSSDDSRISNLSLNNIEKINQGGKIIISEERPQPMIIQDDQKVTVPTTKWVFSHYLGRKNVELNSGQRVRIKTVNNNTIYTQKGKFQTISDSFLIIKNKSGIQMPIPKETIKELTIIRGLGLLGYIIGLVLVGLTLIVGGIVAALESWSTDFDSAALGVPNPSAGSDPKKSNLQKGLVPGLLVLLIGFGLILSSRSTKIVWPFQDKWKVSPESEITNSNEINNEP